MHMRTISDGNRQCSSTTKNNQKRDYALEEMKNDPDMFQGV